VLAVDSFEPLEFIDITDRVAQALLEMGACEGVVVLQTLHTTTGLLVNEHEPLLLADLAALFERIAPEGARYAHDDARRRTVNLQPGERRNGHAHCRAALLRTSEVLAVAGGVPLLGRWQRVFLVDFDGPQRRRVGLAFMEGLSKFPDDRPPGPRKP
jgi:secondary thiamine-phosphate synthase enzyme